MRNKRISLLSDAEIKSLYSRPEFTHEEREFFFSLSDADHLAIGKYHNKKTKLYFILQLGYFRAGKQFYDFSFEEVNEDLNYVSTTYFDGSLKNIKGKISRSRCALQKNDIAHLEGYQQWATHLSPKIEAHLISLIRYFPKGDDTLRELLGYFEKQKIILPSYRTLQDLFTHCFSLENNRLAEITESMPEEIKSQLDEIIKNDDGISQLNVIRIDQKNFQYTSIKLEIDKALSLEELYHFSKTFLLTLKLANNAIRYYASLAELYPVFRLRKQKKSQQWLYLICFVYHRYQQFMDNLITSFMANMATIIADSKAYARKQMLLHGADVVAQFPHLSSFLRWFSSGEHPPNRRFDDLSKEAYAIMQKEQFPVIADYMEGNAFDEEAAIWEFLSESCRMLSLYFRPILLAVDFTFYQPNGKVAELMKLLKHHYSQNKTPSELKIADELGITIPKRMLAYLKIKPTDQYLDAYRFEFYVYKKMFHQLDRGRLYCNESVSYCSLDHDLVSEKHVDKAEAVAKKFGYDKLPIYCDERLDAAMEELDQAWQQTTTRIDAGENTGLKTETTAEGETHWGLLYDANPDKASSSFFKSLGPIEIADIVKYLGDQIDLWRAFSHIKHRGRKQKTPDSINLIACILSIAFGFSLEQMAGMSDINFNQLRSTDENYIRLETIKLANKILCDFTAELPIFKVWDIIDHLTLADADGQKVETTRHTIQSRFSKKYLGRAKGVSVCSLIANHVPVNAKVIGLNEHESHHLYDLVYNNETNIDIDLVTGDNHSINQLNFVALDVIDVGFVPSIKNIRAEAEKLYSTDDPKNYSGLITPVGKIDVALIKSQKRGILRILLSLIMQENTQSVIIKKLSSHKRYSRLRAALWEYNKIFKTIHVLNLINDMQLRKAIRTARNRTEAYHQIQSVIRKIHSGVFRGRKISSNALSSETSRLVANVIIAYNAILLDRLYSKLCLKHGEKVAKRVIAKISPVAWAHLSFTGRYKFKNKQYNLHLEEMLAVLEAKLEKML